MLTETRRELRHEVRRNTSRVRFPFMSKLLGTIQRKVRRKRGEVLGVLLRVRCLRKSWV